MIQVSHLNSVVQSAVEDDPVCSLRGDEKADGGGGSERSGGMSSIQKAVGLTGRIHSDDNRSAVRFRR